MGDGDLDLERSFIERNDFSAARRGYDPEEVDRHLREIAESVQELKRQAKRSPTSMAAQAAEPLASNLRGSASSLQSELDSIRGELSSVREGRLEAERAGGAAGRGGDG